MKNFKRFFATILVFVMLITLPCNISIRAATNTSGSFEQKITQLQKNFLMENIGIMWEAA